MNLDDYSLDQFRVVDE